MGSWQLAALVLALLASAAPFPAAAIAKKKAKVEWQRRAIYQILTDRFASPATMPLPQSQKCTDLANYCGGRWRGIIDQLDYIQGLNLNAVWSSPISEQPYGGYHGYWPTDLYATNPAFGTAEELAGVLEELASQGMYNVLDLVMNHVGYGSSIYLPGYKPFADPSYFHNCTLANCMPGNCVIPSDNPTYDQLWHCRLSGLPDLNSTMPQVQALFAEVARRMLAQFSVHMLRVDAAGNIDPAFFPPFMTYANVGDRPALLEVWGDVALYQQYEAVRNGANWSYQAFPMYRAAIACFALVPTAGMPNVGCEQLSNTRTEMINIGIDMSSVGYWCENHDTDRFLTARDSLPAYRNALAFVLLAEGIPTIYYGAEQGMTGWVADNTNRLPLWEVGYDVGAPLYKYIRTLGWYRWWSQLGNATFDEAYVDHSTYAFVRNASLVAVLTNGNYSDASRPAAYPLTNLKAFANQTLCDALLSGYCVDVAANGTAQVTPSRDGEPLLLVPPRLLRSNTFFTPLAQRPVLWKQGLIVTCSTLAGGVALWLVAAYAVQYRRTGRITPRTYFTARRASAAAFCRDLWRCVRSRSRFAGKRTASEPGMEAANGCVPGRGDLTAEEEARRARLLRKTTLMHAAAIATGQARASAAAAPAPLQAGPEPSQATLCPLEPLLAAPSEELPQQPSATRVLRLDSLVMRRPGSVLHALVDCLKADSHMVMHVALEYAVPHLGLTTQLMYGGLGKVVETFIAHADRPMLVCAPMYAPYYATGPDGELRLAPPFDGADPIMSIPAIMGDRKALVDVYVTAAPHEENGVGKGGSEEGDGQGGARPGASSCGSLPPPSSGAQSSAPPTVFFLLLSSPIFSRRTRGTIYQHANEAEELAFFSTFNQAVAQVVETLGVGCLQLHDYHGALSVLYLPPAILPRTLLVAHNADYNGTWHLGTREREAWVYAQLNVPLNAHTRALCEHEGRFNMLRPLLAHMRATQQGAGVVAVSPRYAIRARAKFSMFWQLPLRYTCGILNGTDSERPPAAAGAAADPDAFFAKKRAAKLAFQQANGLEVGEAHKLLVFMGRITHQKGCDIIAMAAADILKGSPHAQIGMVGPIGDEYGEQAKMALEQVAQAFPRRVWNAAGQYAMGAEKERLLMAADFFFCPSRFEPCGLADIEFGWLGAVMVGHNTGGLGKMPGFYYTCELDCIEEQSIRLASTALKALAAPEQELRHLATQALRADFPPARMVSQYHKAWRRIRALAGRAHRRVDNQQPNEVQHYADQWLEDNTPYNAKEAAARQEARQARELMLWLRSLFLIVMQAVLQVPSVLSLLWYTDSIKAGSIQFQHTTTWASVFSSPVAVFFFIYGGSALACQVVGFLLPPRRYMQTASLVYLAAVLLFLWSLYAPQIAMGVYIANAVSSSTWVPIASFLFLDNSRASVSQHGPLLMGFSDMLQRGTSVAAVWAVMGSQGSTDITGYEAASIVLLLIAVWFALWLLRPRSLSPHFEHRRLRVRGQLAMLLRFRRTWIFAVAITTADTFALGYGASVVFNLKPTMVQWYALASALTNLVAIGATGLLLSLKPGRRLGLRLMWAIASIPGVSVVQALLVRYAGSTGVIVASTALAALHVRTNLVGQLNLHTLPSRETFTCTRTLQVVLGSVALVIGLAAGGTTNHSLEIWLLTGLYEAVRLGLVLAMAQLHASENMAKP